MGVAVGRGYSIVMHTEQTQKVKLTMTGFFCMGQDRMIGKNVRNDLQLDLRFKGE